MKQIRALPSKVELPSGEELLLEGMSEIDIKRIQKQAAAQAGQALSDYYTQNTAEWDAFVKEA